MGPSKNRKSKKAAPAAAAASKKEVKQDEKMAIHKKASSMSSSAPPLKQKRKRPRVTEQPKKGSFRNIQPPLTQGILDFLDSKNFHTMTPVQEATIPLFLQNKDVAVQAVTGSGKTIAFLVPTVQRIRQRLTPLLKHQIGALILSPTRELALQTWTVCSELCKAVDMAPPLLLVGGGRSGKSGGLNHRPVTEDLKTFHRESNDIIIGTPGRMDDILTRYNVLDVTELEILILDEADVLLFGRTVIDPTIASILNRLPKMRRTGIFSATTTFTSNKSVKPLLQRAGMRNPVLINVQVAAVVPEPSTNTDDDDDDDDDDATSDELALKTLDSKNKNDDAMKNEKSRPVLSTTYTPTSLTNYYLVTKLEEKICRLAAFLQSHRHQKTIVFFLTCACVDFYGTAFQNLLDSTKSNKSNDKDEDNDAQDQDGLTIELLHGKLLQKKREKAMERFRQSKTGAVLFATDVAARGLDVTDIDWVVQVDAPQDPSQFVHRVGRSARAGRLGSSLLFLTEKEESYVDLLANRQVSMQELPESEVCRRDIDYASEGDSSTNNLKKDDVMTPINDNGNIVPFLPKIRGIVLKDRDFLEKGTKAFTSYIRAYKEHVCRFIFRFASLDLGHLATSFCLLRLPKMPELREFNGKLKYFISAGPEVDIYKIPFLDKARETTRQKRLAVELAAGGKNAKQIKAEQKKADQVMRSKERRKVAVDKGRNPDKKRGRNAQIVDEWEELAKEERLYKKFRRGKITKEKYEELMFGSLKTGDDAPQNIAAGQESSSDDDDDDDDN